MIGDLLTNMHKNQVDPRPVNRGAVVGKPAFQHAGGPAAKHAMTYASKVLSCDEQLWNSVCTFQARLKDELDLFVAHIRPIQERRDQANREFADKGVSVYAPEFGDVFSKLVDIVLDLESSVARYAAFLKDEIEYDVAAHDKYEADFNTAKKVAFNAKKGGSR
jgi:hypothetical protein